MENVQNDYKIIDGWRYYNVEQIRSAERCTEIAIACQREAFFAKMQSIGCGLFIPFSLAFSYVVVSSSLTALSITGIAPLALFLLPPILGVSILPLVILAVVATRCWQYAEHLLSQSEKARTHLRNIVSTLG